MKMNKMKKKKNIICVYTYREKSPQKNKNNKLTRQWIKKKKIRRWSLRNIDSSFNVINLLFQSSEFFFSSFLGFKILFFSL